ncbi:MAG TPA: hypothetical protein VLY04_03735 [Bryobacteraceae bacterium]|nr:hypothetical protein [Bryobacteraceae bacterium]
MKCIVPVIALFAMLAPGASAQTTDPATKELIEKLLSRIDSLEKRVAELEKGTVAATAAATPAPVKAAQPSAAQAVHMSHEAAPVPQAATPETAPPVYPVLKIEGFGDLDFSATNLHGTAGGFGAQTLLAPHSGFEEGQFTLHFSSALSPKVTVFGETTLTARSDAGTGTPPAPGFNAEVERIIVRYDLNDYFKLSFGRYHTPINYWNTAFHHGQWLQTTISRPEMTQFGGSFIPVHFVGTLVEGETPAGGLNLNYDFGLGNGRGQVLSRGGDFSDINNNRAWLTNLFIKPDALYGLQLGGSVYHDSLNPLNAPAAREWIQSGHIVWQKETPEFIAEFANVSHQPVSGGPTSNSQAFYVQTAYRLPWFQKLWKPYYRFELIHVPRSDAIFRSVVPDFHASTAGIRYDITTFAAFKFEYRHYVRRDGPGIFGFFGQTSFTF